ncbi:PKD domain-containing protein [Pedobacter fastidiosus]|uniref:PKD domain-containing protein n=1 Tax=Pedobacter fastidiosus TaxID=2765361 RepID=A0ABR7KT88_9SPHI|nr:PKD domain-containing protein [Pedobacter fastidiosus]MBC6111326.1 PKD domain-containing protein [Pedobacter fastidiosus]
MKTNHYQMFLASLFLFAGCKKEQITTSKADFSYAIQNSNFTVPVKVGFVNNSTGADNYEWTFEGGIPSASNKKDPGVVQFDQAGSHKIKLRAWNSDNESVKEVTLNLDSAVNIDFDPVIQTNEFSPVQVKITNKTIGAKSYSWTFEGGSPSASTEQQPAIVNFVDTGYHNISLTVSNGRESFSKTKKIHVSASLQPTFAIDPSFEDEDYEAPLTATLQNTTISGQTWVWSSTGGTISNTVAKTPTIHFDQPGTYTITLKASNGKDDKTSSQTIKVLPNKNLRSFTNIKLGINTAHGTVGSFFSTQLRKTFKATDDLDTAGKYIDVVYFGLNQNFSYNKFLSPDSAAEYTFKAIPQAMHNNVISSQELCGCGSMMSIADFENLGTGADFQNYAIVSSANGRKQFTNTTVPRIVLYKTADGRKGAIKVKQFVANGSQSYIIVDVKIQKTP